MNAQPTIFVFPAILGPNQFSTQDVSLGSGFPEISIVLCDSREGLHEFKISKMLPHHHPSLLNPALAEARSQIDRFWMVLSFVRNSHIYPTGEIFYEFQNSRHSLATANERVGPSLSGVAGSGWFDINRADLTKDYDFNVLKRLNFACHIAEPVGKFVALYCLLLSLAEDSQVKLDKLLLEIEPTLEQSRSPMYGDRMETIYTRLRNELSHHRSGVDSFSTHAEVSLHLPRFEYFVRSIFQNHIT